MFFCVFLFSSASAAISETWCQFSSSKITELQSPKQGSDSRSEAEPSKIRKEKKEKLQPAVMRQREGGGDGGLDIMQTAAS